MSRIALPQRRAALTFPVEHFSDLGHRTDISVTMGAFDDGRPSEFFVDANKAGTDVRHAVSDAAILLSIALQCGADLQDIREALSRQHTGGPGSIIGSVVETAVAVLAEGSVR